MTPPSSTDVTQAPADRPTKVLPPVESPSAGFIVQLFVVPALIVVIIAAVVAMINWLAHMGNSPQQYIEALQRDNAARWQVAVSLADTLRNPANESLLSDPRIAVQLADLLNSEIDKGELDDDDVQLRVYLCHALGQMRRPEVLPPLVRAAHTQRDAAEDEVRLAAVRDLVLYADQSPDFKIADHPEVLQAWLEASRHDKPVIRSAACFGLRIGDDPRSRQRLAQLLQDLTPDVSYNAACNLALLGDERCLPVVVQMLEPDQAHAVQAEEVSARDYKQATIHHNALVAAEELGRRGLGAELAELRAAVERFSSAELPVKSPDVAANLRNEARRVLQKLPGAPAG